MAEHGVAFTATRFRRQTVCFQPSGPLQKIYLRHLSRKLMSSEFSRSVADVLRWQKEKPNAFFCGKVSIRLQLFS